MGTEVPKISTAISSGAIAVAFAKNGTKKSQKYEDCMVWLLPSAFIEVHLGIFLAILARGISIIRVVSDLTLKAMGRRSGVAV